MKNMLKDMNPSKLFPLLTIFPILVQLHYLASPTIAQPEFTAFECIYDDGNYTKNSTYATNLRLLLSNIPSKTSLNYGFSNLSVGQKLDIVHGMALCKADVSASQCKTCLGYAAARITEECPHQRDAVGWSEDCTLYYSNENIFNGVNFLPRYNVSNTAYKAIDLRTFNRTVAALLTKLAYQAASGDFRRKFAAGEVSVSSSLKMYALLQCTPNLQHYDCFDCLRIVINYTLAWCCFGDQGARAASPSCNIRYENYKFYGSASVLPPLRPPPFSPPTPSPFPQNRGKRHKRSKLLIIILVPALTSVVILLAVFYVGRRKALKISENVDGNEDETSQIVQSWQMNFATVGAATNNFSDTNKLGQGAFGTVYKGALSTGQAIAVKRLSKNSGHCDKEFQNEALLMAKLQHRNLVRFLGFCLEKDERLLVYEYLPNKSLDYFFNGPSEPLYLDWKIRYKIIEGIARGLLYLHEESRQIVVHRDLKPSNVLLDTEMNPKISDVGLARLFGADQSHAITSKIVGTHGYMPPEYVQHGQFSIKTDVYSFGVLVLEIISGHKVSQFSEAGNQENLLSFAWRNWFEGNPLKLVDSSLLAADTAEVLRCIHIGLLCLQENVPQRPIMSTIVLMLSSYSVTLPAPSRPAFLADTD